MGCVHKPHCRHDFVRSRPIENCTSTGASQGFQDGASGLTRKGCFGNMTWWKWNVSSFVLCEEAGDVERPCRSRSKLWLHSFRGRWVLKWKRGVSSVFGWKKPGKIVLGINYPKTWNWNFVTLLLAIPQYMKTAKSVSAVQCCIIPLHIPACIWLKATGQEATQWCQTP